LQQVVASFTSKEDQSQVCSKLLQQDTSIDWVGDWVIIQGKTL
jgi:hypothetical protein